MVQKDSKIHNIPSTIETINMTRIEKDGQKVFQEEKMLNSLLEMHWFTESTFMAISPSPLAFLIQASQMVGNKRLTSVCICDTNKTVPGKNRKFSCQYSKLFSLLYETFLSYQVFSQTHQKIDTGYPKTTPISRDLKA